MCACVYRERDDVKPFTCILAVEMWSVSLLFVTLRAEASAGTAVVVVDDVVSIILVALIAEVKLFL